LKEDFHGNIGEAPHDVKGKAEPGSRSFDPAENRRYKKSDTAGFHDGVAFLEILS
jgi:hypothetical protein